MADNPNIMIDPDDCERCTVLRQWCWNHPGRRPCRRSDDKTEASLAMWIDRAFSRRLRGYGNRPSGTQLNSTELVHVTSILARPQVVQVVTTASSSRDLQTIKMPTSAKDFQIVLNVVKAWYMTKADIPNVMIYPGDFERCNELRQWFLNHSGNRPRRISEDITEVTLAR